MTAQPIPDGYHTATPYIICKGAARAIEFYKNAFGATELFRMAGPDGKIGHAEIKIGDSVIMMGEEVPDMGIRSPQSLGGTPVGIMLYVEDVDSRFNQAVAAGAKVERPVVDQFYGDRSGTLIDPSGHKWTIGTHKEDIPPDEMDRRFQAWMQEHAAAQDAAAKSQPKKPKAKAKAKPKAKPKKKPKAKSRKRR